MFKSKRGRVPQGVSVGIGVIRHLVFELWRDCELLASQNTDKNKRPWVHTSVLFSFSFVMNIPRL